MPGYLDISAVVRQLQARLDAQEAEIATLQAGQFDVFTCHLRGSVGLVAVPAATLVRIPLPPLVVANTTPTGEWTRNGSGILEYTGNVGGGYEVHCPTTFGVSVAADVVYRFLLVEGTDLVSVVATPDARIRDEEPSAIEKRLLAGDSTTVPSGHLSLPDTGGEISLFVQHTHGAPVTLDITHLSLFLQRSTLA